MCGRSVKGAGPIQFAPSPPMWVTASVGRSGSQPPCRGSRCRPARCEPSGTRVDVLCGQPEQKAGEPHPADRRGRRRRRRPGRARGASLGRTRRVEPGPQPRRFDASAGSSSPSEGTSGAPLVVALADEPRPALRRGCRAGARAAPRSRPASLRHEQVLGPVRKSASALCGSSGHVMRHLVDREPERGGGRCVDAELVERLAHVEVGLAARSRCRAARRSPPSRPRSRPFARTNACAAGKRCSKSRGSTWSGQFDQPMWRPAGGREVVGQEHAHALGPDLDRRRAVDGVGQALEADPAARVAREREAVAGRGRGSPARSTGSGSGSRSGSAPARSGARSRTTSRRGRRREREHAAVRRGARVVAVLERVARAVDAGALAVPDPKTPS